MLTIQGSRLLRVAYLVLKVAVTFAAFYLVFRNYDLAALTAGIDRFKLPWLGAAITLALVQMYVLAWRWQLIHRLLTGTGIPIERIFAATSRSFLYGQLLPAIVGMDAIRIAAISKDFGLKPAIRSVAADRLIGLVTLVVLAAAVVPLSIPVLGRGWGWPAVLTVSAGMTALLLVVLWPGILTAVPKIGTALAHMVQDLRLLLGTRAGAKVTLVSLGAHVMTVVIFALIVEGIGGGVSPIASLVIVPQMQLIITLPVSLGGWGVREAVIVSSFVLLGADTLRGALASVIFGLCNPLVGMMGQVWELFAPSSSLANGDFGRGRRGK
jgi:glycosyltransferase 2 family protein